LDNMIDYGMSRYSWFVDELKGCAYSTDVPGAVKNVSSLNPLNLALVTDDEEIFRKRAGRRPRTGILSAKAINR